MNLKLIFALFIGFIYFPAAANTMDSLAQSEWSLENCIDYALAHNINVKRNQLNVASSEQNLKQARANRLPNLMGSGSQSFAFGRSIDPFTNTFTNDPILSNNFSLTSSIVLFQGFQQTNQIAFQKLNQSVAENELEYQKNMILLSVFGAYMQILFAEELLGNANTQLATTSDQLLRTRKLVDAGVLHEADFLDIQAQKSSDELVQIQRKNQLDLAQLDLVQLLQLEGQNTIDILKPNVEADTTIISTIDVDKIYQAAIEQLPEVALAELNIDAMQKRIAIMKGGRLPTLSLSGSLFTQYSSLGTDVTETPPIVSEIGFITDEPNRSVSSVLRQYEYVPIDFADQLNLNMRNGVSFNLSIPIFMKFQNNTNIKLAIIEEKKAQVQKQQTENDIRKTIQQSYADAKAAQKSFQAAEKQVSALKAVMESMQKKFELGLVNSLEYTTAKNRLEGAQANLIQSKYDLIYRVKILDFYQGNPIYF